MNLCQKQTTHRTQLYYPEIEHSDWMLQVT